MYLYPQKNRNPITDEMLNDALRRKEHWDCVRNISRDFVVDEFSIRSRLKHCYQVKSLGHFRKIFIKLQKLTLAELSCWTIYQGFYGFTRKMVTRMWYELIEVNEIYNNFNGQTELASKCKAFWEDIISHQELYKKTL